MQNVQLSKKLDHNKNVKLGYKYKICTAKCPIRIKMLGEDKKWQIRI